MGTQDHDFLATLRATFALEADEHVQTITAGLLALEKAAGDAGQRELVETIFRAAHSLKGAARAVDLPDVESLCQSLEDAFATWKRLGGTPSTDALDAVHRTMDAIVAALGATRPPRGAMLPPAAAQGSPVQTPPAVLDAVSEPAAPDKAAVAGETVRIAVSKLDARVLEAEEMLLAKLTVRQRAEDVRQLVTGFEPWRKQWTGVEPETRALRRAIDRPAGPAAQPAVPHLGRLLDFVEWNREYVTALERKVVGLAASADHDRQVIGRLVDDLLEHSKQLLLLPFATITAPFPKLVRDLCREQEKEADLVIQGEEVEIDKRILEEMKAPLVHLLRNSVDHGIETPAERVRAGKPARATITLAASHANGKVELLVSDDGVGIDAGRVREAAVTRGVLPAEQARQLDDTQARGLIFESDVSTSASVTRISGRGLGLAIVREKAGKLGGTVSVESQPGRGTRLSIVLPIMLATFRGILIEEAEQLFVLPTSHVERVVRLKADEIRTVEGRNTVALNGRPIALVRLADVLELQRPGDIDPEAPVVVIVLGTGDQRVGFAVDAALDEQEILFKPLHKPLSRVRNVAGATVLGTGRVAPILNVSDLLKSARRTGGAAARSGPAASEAASAGAKSILVAEDSVTSRLLIKGILESAGYTVTTAVDGIEAFTLLRAERFDLLVSDVEMPRLNGFDLTARIRADRQLAELPVVLVTALEAPRHRERGIEAGADAYIVKGSFDQSDLLAAVRRLV